MKANQTQRQIFRRLYLVAALVVALAPTASLAITNQDLNAITDDTNFYDPDAACTPGVGGGTVTGDNNAERAYNFFVSKGLSPAQASGIVGNMIEESGVGPERLQFTAVTQITSAQYMVSTGQYQAGIGWGIVQWTPADQPGNGVIITTANPSQAVNTLAYQLGALWTELNGPKKNALDAIKKDTTVLEAANDWLNLFEIGSPNPSRQIFAQAIYELEVNHTPLPQSVLDNIVSGAAANPGGAIPGGNGTCTNGTAPPSATGCANPFRDVAGLRPERIDQGVDYAGSGPVHAVCAGTILNTINSGWNFGGFDAYISIKISGGPLAGKVSYMAEGCPPDVQVGQQVTTDTVICHLINPQSTGIETGWSAPSGTGQPLAQLYGGNGCCSTTAGVSYNKFLKSLGTPSGILQTNPPIGLPLPPGYP